MQSDRLLSRLARASIGTMALLMCANSSSRAVSSAPGEMRQKTAAEWQAMARADLDAAHALVLSAHPGTIDELNPTFMQWTGEGYRQAQQLIRRVVSYDTAMAAVKAWRNRVRGNNEVLTPDIPLQVNMKDDAAVYEATLAALKGHRH